MQNTNYEDTEKRAVFYAGNLIKNSIKPKEKYAKKQHRHKSNTKMYRT